MAKSMPSNSLSNSHAMSGRTYPLAHDLLAPVGLSSANPWTGEDPIVWATVRRLPTPGAQSFCQHGIKRNRLLRGLSFTRVYHLHHNGSRDANLLVVKSTSFHFNANNSLTLSPVPTAIKKRIRSRRGRARRIRLISPTLSTSGTDLRFSNYAGPG